MLEKAFWIGCKEDFGDICPEFIRAVPIVKKAVSAILTVTAIGVYEARINGVRIGDFILAPGCTVYRAVSYTHLSRISRASVSQRSSGQCSG